MDRRRILKLGVASGLAWVASPRTQVLGDLLNLPSVVAPDWLTLAVQQYSFNRQLRSGEMNILDFPKTVVEGTGIKALEYFNGHIEDKVKDTAFFKQLRKRSDDLGAVNTMMLCRSKNAVDSPDAKIRKLAIEGYRPWLEATKVLGGKYIRVDTRHKGEAEKQKGFAVAGLRSLCKVADEYEMGILVENHGNHSGNGAWLADVMKQVDLANCGTLPDFQNFKEYDPYQGVSEMMPWAKILCAKAKSFDDNGDEENIDFRKMLKIAKAAGFRGYIGIEFEGHGIDPVVGINSTKQLIQKVMRELK
ncbi:sugar phosphate isomerase/epimerase [bacterium]|nr:sugar phosphate isomerase/epimerase [Mariniblastus sp.]MDC0311535.1 sugar phosphate isomerase/epimerase [bacterium]|eukprot:COSAG01_NODE_2501_length_7558_cov_27.574206_4_plen_304_part_00